MVKVYVPATSANVGPGFDSIGFAVNIGNTVKMQQADGCQISSESGLEIPTTEDNLIYKTAKALYKECGVNFTGLNIIQNDEIPLARGLGSSSACIIAGLLGANELMKNPLNQQDILDMSVRIEGHPDNVSPALLGGYVMGCLEGGKAYVVRRELSPKWEYAAFIPDFEFLTKDSRGILPATVSREDAVYNMTRALMSCSAFCDGDESLIKVAVQDRLHQPYRLKNIKGSEEVFALAENCGAKAVFLSGAGPTIMAVVKSDDKAFWNKAKAAIAEEKTKGTNAGVYKLVHLKADNIGARVVQKQLIDFESTGGKTCR